LKRGISKYTGGILMYKKITAVFTVLVLTLAMAVPAAFAAGSGCNGTVQALDNTSERIVLYYNNEQPVVADKNPDLNKSVTDGLHVEDITAIIPDFPQLDEIAVPDFSLNEDVKNEQPQSQPSIDVTANAPDNSVNIDHAANPPDRPNVGQVSNTGLNAMENEMLRLVNDERAKAGLKPLESAPDLARVARMKSQDMVDNGYFSHQSPTYGSPFEMIRDNGISYRAAGENIAMNGSVLKAHQALMNSDGHRANILNPNFTHIGIGIVQNNGKAGIMVTQLFIAR
jgi:uncharacterized YkwD family protein